MRYILRANFTRISKSSSARGREPASTSRRCSASASETGGCSTSGTSLMYQARARPTAKTAGAMRESGGDNRDILLRAKRKGTARNGGGGKHFTSDFRGSRLTETDESGHTTTFEYDLAGQLVKTTYAAGSFTSGSAGARHAVRRDGDTTARLLSGASDRSSA